MHLGNLGQRRDQPAANGPNRLVGQDQQRRVQRGRNRACELRANHRKRVTRLSLAQGFAQTDDGAQPSRLRGLGFGGDQCIGFAMSLAPFGMAHDHRAGAQIAQLHRRNIAGECPAALRMAILRADGQGAAFGMGKGRVYQRGRGADQRINMGGQRCLGQLVQLRQIGQQPVHFPVPRRQFPPHTCPQ